MGKTGRKNRKYPWDKIPRKGSITIRMKSPKAIKSAINAVYGYANRTDKKFTIKRSSEVNEDTGETTYAVRIWRIA